MAHTTRRAATARALLAVAALWCVSLAPAAAQQLPEREWATVDTVVRVGVGWYQAAGGERREDGNALARALELAAPGCTVLVEAGNHPPFGIGFTGRQNHLSKGRGGTALKPVVVRGQSGAILGTGSDYDTIQIGQGYPVGHVHFENFLILAGSRTAVIFHSPPEGQANRGFAFYDCTIDGGFDHATQTGRDSKWGVQAWGIADFVFAGRAGRAAVRNIRHEHAFYVHQPLGDITIENTDGIQLGRTFFQVVARESEGAPGRGRITLRNCSVEDSGLAARDNHKGGYAFTFAGRLEECTITVEACRFRAGFEPKLRHLTRPGSPYGTGALVAWDGRETRPNGALILRDNHFEMAPGTGDRALVSIGATRSVSVEGKNHFLAGGHALALVFDPVDGAGRPTGLANGPIFLDPATVLRGELQASGRPVDASTRAAWARPLSER